MDNEQNDVKGVGGLDVADDTAIVMGRTAQSCNKLGEKKTGMTETAEGKRLQALPGRM